MLWGDRSFFVAAALLLLLLFAVGRRFREVSLSLTLLITQQQQPLWHFRAARLWTGDNWRPPELQDRGQTRAQLHLAKELPADQAKVVPQRERGETITQCYTCTRDQRSN